MSKPFKEQTQEERYLGLVDRLNNLVTNWEMWRQDCLRNAESAKVEGGTYGKISGLHCQANLLSNCYRQLSAVLRLHNKVIERQASPRVLTSFEEVCQHQNEVSA